MILDIFLNATPKTDPPISLLKDRITYIHIDSLLERKAILITADQSSCYVNSLCKIPRDNAVAIPTSYYK